MEQCDTLFYVPHIQKDVCEVCSTSSMRRPLRYMTFMSLTQVFSRATHTFHASFIMKALFMSSIFLIPKLPLIFGWHSVSQDFKYIWCCLSSRTPQTNLLVITSIFFKRLYKTWNICIIKVGIAWRTELAKVNLPAIERNFCFHPDSLLAIFSITLSKPAALE